jgi:hypothetical protein
MLNYQQRAMKIGLGKSSGFAPNSLTPNSAKSDRLLDLGTLMNGRKATIDRDNLTSDPIAVGGHQ